MLKGAKMIQNVHSAKFHKSRLLGEKASISMRDNASMISEIIFKIQHPKFRKTGAR